MVDHDGGVYHLYADIFHVGVGENSMGSNHLSPFQGVFGEEHLYAVAYCSEGLINTPIGPYHYGYQVPWLPGGWRAERDSSIIPQAPGRKPCEFVSPKLRGEQGLQEVAAAVDVINERGGRVNRTCGLHITLTWNGDAAALARLISLVGNHERAIYASTGSKRRERERFSKKIKEYGNHDDAKRRCEADRYHLLNLTHLARGERRIEFRAFSGTLNKTKISAYVMMCIGLVELALNTRRRADWEYNKRAGCRSCWDRPGAGQGETELRRLYYRLGWTKGWYKGALRDKAFGFLPGESGMKEIKAKLMQLARKYDSAG